MARRDDREYRAIFEGGATQPAGMHRRPNAAGLSPRAVKPMVQLHLRSSGAASLLHANAAAAPGARLCNASRAPGSRASRRTTCEFRAFFVGGADLPGACSHFADTLLGLRLLCLACALAIAGSALAARGESLAASDGRCIPAPPQRGCRVGDPGAGCVAPSSNTPGIATPPRKPRAAGAPVLGRRALPAGRLTRLGATPDFHHGLLVVAQPQ